MIRVRISIFLAAVLIAIAGTQDKSVSRRWVSAWSTAVHTPLPFPGLPPSPVFENQTVRMVVRPTIGGERVRIRLSNAFAATALAVGAAHIALTAQDARVVPGSYHSLTFRGRH